MKKILLLIAYISVFLVSCNNKNSSNTNLLQFDLTEVQYKPDTLYFEKKFDFTFFKKLSEAVINGKISTFDFPLFTFDFNGKLDCLKPEQLKSDLAEKNFVIGTEDTVTGKITNKTFIRNFNNDARSIYFIENWTLDNDLKFSKTIKYYAPVRFFFTTTSTENKMPNLAFVVANKDLSGTNDKELIQIAKHIFYTVSLNSNENGGPLILGLNKQILLSLLVDSVIKRNTKVFDVDLNKFDVGMALSKEQARKNIGERVDSVATTDENGNMIVSIDTLKASDCKRQIKEIFFIEDWYYDSKTFSIKKDIIAFGPIREFENAEIQGRIQRSIPYAIVLK